MAKMGKVTVEVGMNLNLMLGGKRVIILDIDTGDWVIPVAISGGDGVRLAASVLPGWPAELIDKAYSEWLQADAAPVNMMESFKYGTIPRDLQQLLIAAHVSVADFATLRVDFASDWKRIAFTVGERTAPTGIYRKP